MANSKITELTGAGSLTGAEVVPVVQSGATVRTTLTALGDLIVGLIVDSAPGTLNTLNELAAALADDPNFATTMTNALAGKLPVSWPGAADGDVLTVQGDLTVAPETPFAVDLSGAADGDVLTVQLDGTVAPEAPAGGGGGGLDVWEQLIVPIVQRPLVASADNWHAVVQYDALMSGFFTNAGSQDANVQWEIPMSAGTWTIRVTYIRHPNNGIMHFLIDGAEVGTIDSFGAGAADFVSAITGVVVAASGVKTFEVKMATKNADPGTFYLAKIQAIQLQRTA